MSAFVLIHGAWSGAWCWDRLTPLLRAKGHEAIALDLPGHGTNRISPELVSFDDYVASVVQVMRGLQGEPILVGHSMGGFTISAVAELMPERVTGLVYLCALLPKDGDSPAQMTRDDPEANLSRCATFDPERMCSTFREEKAAEILFGMCAPDEAASAAAKLARQPVRPVLAPVHLTAQRFGEVPKYYIETLQDRSVSLTLQRRMQQSWPCRRVFALDTDHSPFLSAPDDLASILCEIARSGD
jgi:pimeloyl-ACP methyl ester carboxylesterase